MKRTASRRASPRPTGPASARRLAAIPRQDARRAASAAAAAGAGTAPGQRGAAFAVNLLPDVPPDSSSADNRHRSFPTGSTAWYSRHSAGLPLDDPQQAEFQLGTASRQLDREWFWPTSPLGSTPTMAEPVRRHSRCDWATCLEPLRPACTSPQRRLAAPAPREQRATLLRRARRPGLDIRSAAARLVVRLTSFFRLGRRLLTLVVAITPGGARPRPRHRRRPPSRPTS